MCTVLISFHCFPQQLLRIAANRDERLDRPADTFSIWSADPRLFAPRDLAAGGTWIGVNEHGLVAAITNRFGANSRESVRSRGELVPLALEYSEVGEATEAIRSLSPNDYNGFHLTVASQHRVETVWSDGQTFRSVVRDPGFYVVTERSFGAAESPREEWLQAQLGVLETPHEFDQLLLHEASDGFNGTLVSVPEMNYGTRSSTIIGLGQTPELLHSHGRPDRVDYDDLSESLRSLLDH